MIVQNFLEIYLWLIPRYYWMITEHNYSKKINFILEKLTRFLNQPFQGKGDPKIRFMASRGWRKKLPAAFAPTNIKNR